MAEDPSSAWQLYLRAFEAMVRARMAALRNDHDGLTAQIAASLLRGGWEDAAALAMIPCLPEAQALELMPDIAKVAIAVSGQTAEARRVISSLPHEPAVAALLKLQEDIVGRRDCEEMSGLVELWMALDRDDLARRLATLAEAGGDESLVDVGKTYLAKLDARARGA